VQTTLTKVEISTNSTLWGLQSLGNGPTPIRETWEGEFRLGASFGWGGGDDGSIGPLKGDGANFHFHRQLVNFPGAVGLGKDRVFGRGTSVHGWRRL